MMWLVHYDPPSMRPAGVWTEAPDSTPQNHAYYSVYVEQGTEYQRELAVSFMMMRPAAMSWGDWAAQLLYQTPTKVVWGMWVSPDESSPFDVLRMVLDTYEAELAQRL
jgi:hypothetical protein